MSEKLEAYAAEIRKLALLEWNRESGKSYRDQIDAFRKAFAYEFNKAYFAKYGEYPIAFASFEKSYISLSHTKAKFVVDFGQSEMENYEYLEFRTVDKMLAAAYKLIHRGSSSEIIRRDIEGEVDWYKEHEVIRV